MSILSSYHPNQIVFIHVPRTAGTSICQALGLTNSHDIWSDRYMTDAHYKFSVVRNPWDQVRSWFVSARIAETRDVTFEEWCADGFWVGPTEHYADTPERELPWFMRPHPFKQAERIGPRIDDVFKYEELDSWWPKLAGDIELPCINKSEGEFPVYTERAALAVAEFARTTIEIYGYEIPEGAMLPPNNNKD